MDKKERREGENDGGVMMEGGNKKMERGKEAQKSYFIRLGALSSFSRDSILLALRSKISKFGYASKFVICIVMVSTQ